MLHYKNLFLRNTKQTDYIFIYVFSAIMYTNYHLEVNYTTQISSRLYLIQNTILLVHHQITK